MTEAWGGDDDDLIDGGPGQDLCNGQAGTNSIANCEPPPAPEGLTGASTSPRRRST